MRLLIMKKLTFFLMIIFFFSHQTEAWEKSLEKDGVIVYTRSVPYSSIKEYKAMVVVQASLSRVLSVFNDISNYPNWMHFCQEAKMIKEISPKEKYIYLKLQPSGPVSPRDVVVYAKIHKDIQSKAITIKLKNKPDVKPKRKGIVRIPKLKGFYKIQPIKSGKLEITYQQFVDPGGSVPAFLVNTTITEEPYNTLKSLKNEIKKTQYKNTK